MLTVLMVSFSDVCAILKSYVVEAVKPKIEDWLPALTIRETNEVRALASALGNLKPRSRPRDQSLPSRRGFSVRSSYEEAYGAPDHKQHFETAILRYRQLQELPCSSVLTAKGVQTLQVWLDRADAAMAAPVLNGLRTLYSLLTVRVRPPTSNNRTSYSGFSPEDFRRSTTRTEFFPSRRRQLRSTQRETPSPSPTKTAPMPVPPGTCKPRPRGAHMLSDRRLLSFGDGETDPASLYQKTYITHYFKYKPSRIMDYHTSVTHSLIPDLSLTAQNL